MRERNLCVHRGGPVLVHKYAFGVFVDAGGLNHCGALLADADVLSSAESYPRVQAVESTAGGVVLTCPTKPDERSNNMTSDRHPFNFTTSS